MFGYKKTVRAFKADCSNFSTPYDEEKAAKAVIQVKKHRNAPRITVCAAAALALVITGSVVTPAVLGTSKKGPDTFEFVAYAVKTSNPGTADIKSRRTFKEGINIKLPKAKLYYDKKYHSINYTIGYVSCTGNNLSNVTYSCDMGTLEYSSTEIYQKGKNSVEDKKIIANASDRHAWLVWNPSAQDYDEIMTMQIAFGKINYSVLCGDAIKVQAKFNDGKTILRYIMISFDKSGNLCAKLTTRFVPQV